MSSIRFVTLGYASAICGEYSFEIEFLNELEFSFSYFVCRSIGICKMVYGLSYYRL